MKTRSGFITENNKVNINNNIEKSENPIYIIRDIQCLKNKIKILYNYPKKIKMNLFIDSKYSFSDISILWDINIKQYVLIINHTRTKQLYIIKSSLYNYISEQVCQIFYYNNDTHNTSCSVNSDNTEYNDIELIS